VRFHQNLAAAGVAATRRVLRLETRPAGPREAEALALAAGAPVHVFEGLSLGDGAPMALFRSVFPAERLPGLAARLAHEPSITAALAAEGVGDYTRASTRLTAKLATPLQAVHLQVAAGAPILRSVAINVDAEGRPVEYGTSWFAGDRVTLVVTPDPT
jgi:GntR family phosphonate transport system transcriptional regulator